MKSQFEPAKGEIIHVRLTSTNECSTKSQNKTVPISLKQVGLQTAVTYTIDH